MDIPQTFPHARLWIAWLTRAVGRYLSQPPLALALVVLLILVSAAFAVHGFANPLGTDYLATLTGAHLLAAGSHCLYCESAQTVVQQGLLHQPVGRIDPYLQLPVVALLARPLSGLEPAAGFAFFIAASAAAVSLAAMLLWQGLGLKSLGWAGVSIIALTALSVPAAWNYWLAQTDALLLLPAAAGTVLMKRGHTFLAGLLLSVVLLKPQTVWFVPVILLASRQWRPLVGMAIGFCLWIGISVTLVGPAQLVAWAHLLATLGPTVDTSIGLAGMIANMAGGQVALLVSVGLALGAAAYVWRVRRALAREPLLALGLAVAASALLGLHYFAYDLVMMAVPICLLARYRPDVALSCGVLLNVAYLVDHYLVGSGAPLETAAVLLLCAGIMREILRAEGLGTTSAMSGHLVRFIERPPGRWRSVRQLTPPALRHRRPRQD
jgi:hypothetical protein